MAMQLCSPSASSSSSSCPCSNPRFTLFKIPRKPLRLPSSSGRATAVLMDRSVKSPARRVPLEKRSRNELEEKKPPPAPEGVLVVRRPEIESDRPEFVEKGEEIQKPSAAIDGKLEEFAKKMPIFEPDRLDENAGAGSAQAKPLSVNLDLALYRAKVLSRSFRYQEAEAILQQCISTWPEDGRAYVALGKILGKQSKTRDARAVYEKGCQATQGENPYVWQCWAVLENRMGNIRRARELFDAATVADKKHIAAWHGWAVLELKQGNVKKARQLLARALKFCGGNEYVYQTLALLEARANRSDQARYLFREATKCNPKSCASWLAWAQLEMQQENNLVARQLFEKAVQASPKNRFAWQVWGVFEATIGNIEKARKLLKIGHALNPKDPVLLQSLALIEYKHSTANLARVLFRKASQLDPRHQPVWIAWGWMEWKEGNVSTARELYQRALSISTTTESAARCLQAWGVLEQRAGNLSAARRLFRSSLNINSQSYVTWMTWAKLEEDQGNAVRAEEIRNLYFQQRTEVVDDSSWVTGFFDIIDPALDSIKKLLNLDQNFYKKEAETGAKDNNYNSMLDEQGSVKQDGMSWLDLDSFIKTRLSLDPAKLDLVLDSSPSQAVAAARLLKSPRSIWRPEQRSVALSEPGV